VHDFGHLPGASTEVFEWLQKATLGSSLLFMLTGALAAAFGSLPICRAPDFCRALA